ncbi:MAG: agmatinase family protein [Bacteroidota bacterium]
MIQPNKSRDQKIAGFNPDGVGNVNNNIFGLPFTPAESTVVIIPVPWDVTVSNAEGTSQGPANILEQSPQIDLYDERVKEPWKAGIAMDTIVPELQMKNEQLRKKATEYIQMLESNPSAKQQHHYRQILEEVNRECSQLCSDVRTRSLELLQQQKLPVIIGGDHSTPLGLIQALAEKNETFGILQIDAHADLRNAYMGFEHSHASIMFNASQLKAVSRVVQVGLRDISAGEAAIIHADPEKFHAFFARNLSRQLYTGTSWAKICSQIIDALPQKVYLSFDIDGLDPSQCTSTGTPVPGGLNYNQVLFLFEELVNSGRTIIGFDLAETGPAPNDGITACRILYKTIALMLQSNGWK